MLVFGEVFGNNTAQERNIRYWTCILGDSQRSFDRFTFRKRFRLVKGWQPRQVVELILLRVFQLLERFVEALE